MDDNEDDPAMQTSILAHATKPKKLSNTNKSSTRTAAPMSNIPIQQSIPPLNTQFTFSSTPTPHYTHHKSEKKERKKRNTKQLKEI